MISNAWAFCCCLLAMVQVQAQYSESIRADRPGQANVPFVVGKGVFQMQTGFDHSQPASRLNRSDLGTVLRLGLTESLEFNGGIGYSWINYTETDRNFNGVGLSEIGFRANAWERSGWTPSLGFQYTLKLPSPSEEFTSKNPASKIILITAQQLGNSGGLTTNLGLDWDGDNGNTTTFYVINLSLALDDRFSIFAEQYGYFYQDEWTGKIDAGFAYLATRNLQLDLYGGWGDLGEQAENYFISLGVSWRSHFINTN